MYPVNLVPITPKMARNGDLSDEQKAAIAQMKSFTDFNDLATKSKYGNSGVQRQVVNIINQIIDRNHDLIKNEQQQEYAEKLEQRQVQRKAMKI